MNKYLFVIFFFPILAQAVVIAPVEPGTYLINETQTNSHRIDYTIAGGSTDNPIIAFAVGFNGIGSTESYAGIDNFDILGGAVALSGFDWDNTFLSVVGNRPFALDFSLGLFQDINATANEFFGLSWAEFLAFDTSTPNYAAIFLTLGGISSEFPINGFFVEGGTTATPTIIQTSNGVISGGPAGQANTINSLSPVPAPAAIWLFGSGLIGLIGMRKKSTKLSELSA